MDPLGATALVAAAAVAARAIYKQSQRDAEARRQHEATERIRTAEEDKAYAEKRRRWAEYVAEAETKSHFLVPDLRETYSKQHRAEVRRTWPAKRKQYAALKAEITTDPDYRCLDRELGLKHMFCIHDAELDVLRKAETLTDSEFHLWEARQVQEFREGLKPAPAAPELTGEELRSIWEEKVLKPLDYTCERLGAQAIEVVERHRRGENVNSATIFTDALMPLFYQRFVACLKRDSATLQALTDAERQVCRALLVAGHEATGDTLDDTNLRRGIAKNLAITEQGAMNAIRYVIEETYNRGRPKLTRHESMSWEHCREEFILRLGHARTPEGFLPALSA